MHQKVQMKNNCNTTPQIRIKITSLTISTKRKSLKIEFHENPEILFLNISLHLILFFL